MGYRRGLCTLPPIRSDLRPPHCADEFCKPLDCRFAFIPIPSVSRVHPRAYRRIRHVAVAVPPSYTHRTLTRSLSCIHRPTADGHSWKMEAANSIAHEAASPPLRDKSPTKPGLCSLLACIRWFPRDHIYRRPCSQVRSGSTIVRFSTFRVCSSWSGEACWTAWLKRQDRQRKIGRLDYQPLICIGLHKFWNALILADRLFCSLS